MLTVLAFADMHSRDLQLPDIQPNVVVLLGDIGFRDVDRINAAYSCPKIGVLGNHDGPDYFDDTEIIDLHGKKITINGISFGGFGGARRYSDKPFGQYEEEEAEQALERLGRVDLFLAHDGPAKQNEPTDRAHRGFDAFTAYVKTYKPTYFLHGHMHEDKQYTLGNTLIRCVFGSKLVKIA